MFKKALAHHGTATPLRSSARRQLLSAIVEQYPAFRSDASDNDTETKVDKELGRLILPEGVRSGTMETSGGIQGTLYTNSDGDPLWMTLGRNSKEYIPTLYLLSLRLPLPPLPILQLAYPLPPPLLTGAPLFLPAVRNLHRPHLLPEIDEAGLVAFVVDPGDGEVRYVGVGRVIAPGGMRGAWELRERNSKGGVERDEGRFADILCILDDHLWDMGSKPELPTFILPPPSRPLVAPPVEAGPSRPRSPPVAIKMECLDISETQPEQPKSSLQSLDPSEISTLLSLALLQSLQEPLSFPMPASLLYSAHILPNRPAYIPKEQREHVVIAKSEWKKLGKWMKEAGKEGILKVKETKGEFVVTGFDAKHPSVASHVTYVTVAEDEAKAAKRAAKEALASGDGTASGTKGKGKEIAIEELWRPSSGAMSFWDACGFDGSILHPSASMKPAVDDYIIKHNLVDPREHRYILLDDELGKAVGIKKPQPGERMARDEVIKKLKTGVTWSVSIGGTLKKGALSPITLTVRTRQGRKTVTHVIGLETFSVEVDDFAEELRKLCAGSASVQPLTGASPKLNLQEIIVQGSQVKTITEALVAKGVPKRWIKEGDGDGKKKK